MKLKNAGNSWRYRVVVRFLDPNRPHDPKYLWVRYPQERFPVFELVVDAAEASHFSRMTEAELYAAAAARQFRLGYSFTCYRDESLIRSLPVCDGPENTIASLYEPISSATREDIIEILHETEWSRQPCSVGSPWQDCPSSSVGWAQKSVP